jgi:hypothetical protein
MRYNLSNLVFILCILATAQSCDIGGDYTSELSGNYFYRSEGQSMHDILCHDPGGKPIPANVKGYDCDNDFIVAVQRPNKSEDPMYETNYDYPKGRDQDYYWLIIHRRKMVLGPLLEHEFIDARKKYNVPETLNVKRYPR